MNDTHADMDQTHKLTWGLTLILRPTRPNYSDQRVGRNLTPRVGDPCGCSAISRWILRQTGFSGTLDFPMHWILRCTGLSGTLDLSDLLDFPRNWKDCVTTRLSGTANISGQSDTIMAQHRMKPSAQLGQLLDNKLSAWPCWLDWRLDSW